MSHHTPLPHLADALNDWLTMRSAGRGLSANTLRAYRADIAAVAEQLAAGDGNDVRALERVHVDDLTPDAVVTALARLKHHTPATRVHRHGTLAALCTHLVNQGHLRINPMAESGLERPKQPRSLPRYIERDSEMARAVDAAAHPLPADVACGRSVTSLSPRSLLEPEWERVSSAACASATSCSTSTTHIRVQGKGGAARACPFRRS